MNKLNKMCTVILGTQNKNLKRHAANTVIREIPFLPKHDRTVEGLLYKLLVADSVETRLEAVRIFREAVKSQIFVADAEFRKDIIEIGACLYDADDGPAGVLQRLKTNKILLSSSGKEFDDEAVDISCQKRELKRHLGVPNVDCGNDLISDQDLAPRAAKGRKKAETLRKKRKTPEDAQHDSVRISEFVVRGLLDDNWIVRHSSSLCIGAMIEESARTFAEEEQLRRALLGIFLNTMVNDRFCDFREDQAVFVLKEVACQNIRKLAECSPDAEVVFLYEIAVKMAEEDNWQITVAGISLLEQIIAIAKTKGIENIVRTGLDFLVGLLAIGDDECADVEDTVFYATRAVRNAAPQTYVCEKRDVLYDRAVKSLGVLDEISYARGEVLMFIASLEKSLEQTREILVYLFSPSLQVRRAVLQIMRNAGASLAGDALQACAEFVLISEGDDWRDALDILAEQPSLAGIAQFCQRACSISFLSCYCKSDFPISGELEHPIFSNGGIRLIGVDTSARRRIALAAVIAQKQHMAHTARTFYELPVVCVGALASAAPAAVHAVEGVQKDLAAFTGGAAYAPLFAEMRRQREGQEKAQHIEEYFRTGRDDNVHWENLYRRHFAEFAAIRLLYCSTVFGDNTPIEDVVLLRHDTFGAAEFVAQTVERRGETQFLRTAHACFAQHAAKYRDAAESDGLARFFREIPDFVVREMPEVLRDDNRLVFAALVSPALRDKRVLDTAGIIAEALEKGGDECTKHVILEHAVADSAINERVVLHARKVLEQDDRAETEFVLAMLGRVLDRGHATLNVLVARPIVRQMNSGHCRETASHCFSKIVQSLHLSADASMFSAETQQIIGTERAEFDRLLCAEKAPVRISAGNVQLREYQRQGVEWLAFLHSFNMNGALCDDMGLGKTVQTLVLLQTLKEDGACQNKKRSLIVCPSSLMGHWASDCSTKTPAISAAVIDTKAAATGIAEKAEDIIVTSYDVFRLSHEDFVAHAWNYVVIDEGHIIKNAETLIAKRLKCLTSEHRLVLTGTPIQNNVLDLWSLFDFLMPGYLGDLATFTRDYVRPIMAAKDAKASLEMVEESEARLDELHRKILPFVLRRMKDDVLKELPPKIIEDVYCDLSAEQTELLRKIDEKGKKQKEILQHLDEVRKVCSHPNLLYPSLQSDDWAKTAPKVRVLEELFRFFDLESGYHKVLVFFQFKKTIRLIIRDVIEKTFPGLKYLVLDGDIDPLARTRIVEKFNTTDTSVLLITTKIGGLGLNLSTADKVVFFEHDWNPMNDLQAMDRAHRIGQKQVLSVFRIITRNTIEEHMLSLQKFKKQIAGTIINQQNTSSECMELSEILEKFGQNN